MRQDCGAWKADEVLVRLRWEARPASACSAADQCRADLATSAARELGAFVAAVDQVFGAEASQRAATYWLECFEPLDLDACDDDDAFRRVTIEAASKVAIDVTGIPCC